MKCHWQGAVMLLLFSLSNGSIVADVSDNVRDKDGRIIPPTTSQQQGLIHQNTVPKDFKTEIIVPDAKARSRAKKIVEFYKLLESNPTIANVRKYVSDDYIQHSWFLPDGPQPLAMLFSTSAAQYPAKIDVHKIIVVGDWAMAHVNFRNLDHGAKGDLGMAAVDMYLFGPDGKIVEHWDVIQNVPKLAPNPNGMFVKLFKGGRQ
ncbi:nuclear transport factor 2 family protein [Pseudobacteriovorax antillogorgiicola]|uniref:Predicted SnoaL-like aldol condensation-catalyzing enzyme n=1 Tax=Pseudobacteriovorax antillogorgiicola TaxID=1513793 RepID=A0A1Y6CRJ3_9BACT|nr:ester cyclase [Pseudobacteriovorax antillogorgiicola]TCS41566.1 putative SnoaL-like aldol condensation-catalyzing enzyme [Pseudobacteriovorax antillogorgiicola]SMF83358.1 Predicted SnoaL-like aldol condensation-catalyzing enzyme [Pseudobacteriovorax antillogorgiicola]